MRVSKNGPLLRPGQLKRGCLAFRLSHTQPHRVAQAASYKNFQALPSLQTRL